MTFMFMTLIIVYIVYDERFLSKYKTLRYVEIRYLKIRSVLDYITGLMLLCFKVFLWVQNIFQWGIFSYNDTAQTSGKMLGRQELFQKCNLRTSRE